MRIQALVLVPSIAVLWAATTTAAVAGGEKVEVCHHTGNGSSHIIEVSANAVAAHIANHGDNVVTDEACDGIDNDCDGEIDERACICEDTLSFCSDTENHYVDGDPTTPAVATYAGHPDWRARIGSATWIWESYYVSAPTKTQTVDLYRDFSLPASATATSTRLQIAGDNLWSVDLNGTVIASGSAGWNTRSGYTYSGFDRAIDGGDNSLVFTVTNIGGSASPLANPAGLLYCMSVAYEYYCDDE